MRGSEYSLSDIRAVTDGNNGGFGDGSGAWWLIVLIVLFGYGRGGFYGGGDGTTNNVRDMYTLNSDFATLQRQLSDGFSDLKQTGSRLGDGICNLGYTQAQLINGVNTSVLQNANTLNTNIMGGVNTLQGAIKDCCCTTQRSIDNVNFNIQGVNNSIATQTNALQNAMCLNTRDIIENQNLNYRQIHDELINIKLENKNERIAQQQNEINALRLSASQSAQNNYLVTTLTDRLAPQPRPSYIVPNPNCCYNQCNCNTSCGY